MHQQERPAGSGVRMSVRVVERLEHLADAMQREAGREHAALLGDREGQGAQIAARDVLHRQVVALAHRTDVEDVADVPVVELHDDARLVDEARGVFAVVGQVRPQRLDHAVLLEARHRAVLGQEHFAHAAARHRRQQQVVAERTRVLLGRRRRQVGCGLPVFVHDRTGLVAL